MKQGLFDDGFDYCVNLLYEFFKMMEKNMENYSEQLTHLKKSAKKKVLNFYFT